jgi:hypothetical protein
MIELLQKHAHKSKHNPNRYKFLFTKFGLFMIVEWLVKMCRNTRGIAFVLALAAWAFVSQFTPFSEMHWDAGAVNIGALWLIKFQQL